jgi:hypothetical protein
VKLRLAVTVFFLLGLVALVPDPALAHCDSLDGPVARDARAALEAKDVSPVLKWVLPEKEGEVREAFQHALAVRVLGAEARALADRFFLETLVRVHREGEGEPFTGLKPAGAPVDPGIAAADAALDAGSVDALAKLLATEVDRGLRERYARAARTRPHAAESVERGREYVAAYVDFMNYAERLLGDATSGAAHAGHQPPAPPGHVH